MCQILAFCLRQGFMYYIFTTLNRGTQLLQTRPANAVFQLLISTFFRKKPTFGGAEGVEPVDLTPSAVISKCSFVVQKHAVVMHACTCWGWNESEGSGCWDHELDAKQRQAVGGCGGDGGGVSSPHRRICLPVYVGLCSLSAACDPFADRPQRSLLCRGFHANAASGKTKDEDALGGDQREALFFFFLACCLLCVLKLHGNIETWEKKTLRNNCFWSFSSDFLMRPCCAS